MIAAENNAMVDMEYRNLLFEPSHCFISTIAMFHSKAVIILVHTPKKADHQQTLRLLDSRLFLTLNLLRHIDVKLIAKLIRLEYY